MNEDLRQKLNHFQRIALIVGITGLLLCVLAVVLNAHAFFPAWLFASLFWVGLALGCLCVAMIHYLTGGRWGNPTRRFLEAGYMTLPVMALLFIPVLFAVKQLYPWARADEVAESKFWQNSSAYMNAPAFAARAIFYFFVWIVMAWLLRKWSLAQDETTDVEPTRRMRTLSGPGIVVYFLTTTFAFIDWVMSLETDWSSTMFGVIICAGQVLTSFAFITMLLAWFRQFDPIAPLATTTVFHHLGNLLLSFVIFWTYVSFGQLLVIWSGNLPREIVWYLHRIAGGWRWIVAFLAAFHFFFPFFLLLFRGTKRHARALTVLAAIIFVAHVVAVFWFVTPSFYPNGIRIHWADFAAWFGLGGIWLATFIAALKRGALLARNDPRVEKFLHPVPAYG